MSTAVAESFNDILKHLISLEVDASATDAKIMSFNGVTAPEFEAITHIVQESPFFLMKLKLTHDPQLSVIIVEWPKAMHEIPLTDFRDELNSAVWQLPINRQLLHAALETNFLIQSSQTRFPGIPDLSLTLLAMTSHKIKMKEVAACPEIILIIMILIKEAQDYHSPVEGLVAWSQLSNQNWLDKDSFLRLRHSNVNSNESDSHLQGEHFTFKLVIVAEHCWCNIASVEYHVWVKSSSIEKIDIDEHQMTSGIVIQMNGVESKIKEGLSKVKQSIIDFTRNLQANADTCALENAEMTLAIDWHVIQQVLQPVVNITAYSHYHAWYKSLCGIKCSHSEDEEYEDEERDDSNTSTSSSTCLVPCVSPTPTHPVTCSQKTARLM
ncbi:hypothetical protein EDC04DRAFT_2597913 [Pisolithus marmoratus]|nr:hypothetical protein EDC04DRAFT_2597913 [Pisolithus marmoratus]